MSQDGFHALMPTKPGDVFDEIFSKNQSRTAVFIEVKTRSGRVFRYNLSDYRFGPELTTEQAHALAQQIASVKYKECEWDRGHPRVDAEAEIAEELLKHILESVENMRAEGR